MSLKWHQTKPALREETLEHAVKGLAKLLHDEYPEGWNLLRIARTYGYDLSAEETAAIQIVMGEMEL